MGVATGNGAVPVGDTMLNGAVRSACSRLSGVPAVGAEVLLMGAWGTDLKGSLEQSSSEVAEKLSLK